MKGSNISLIITIIFAVAFIFGGILCLIIVEERAPITMTSSDGRVETKWVKQEGHPFREIGSEIMDVSSVLCALSVIVYLMIRRKEKIQKMKEDSYDSKCDEQ